MLVVPIPWAGRYWALPFCSVLAPSARYYVDRQRVPRTLTERARQLVLLVRRWVPDRQVVVVADSSFSSLRLLDAVGQQVSFVTRLKLNAQLYNPPPKRVPGTLGRPPLKGKRQPALRNVFNDPATVSEKPADMIKIPRSLFECLIDTLGYAA